MLAAPVRAASDFLSLGILWSARLEKPPLASPVGDRDRVYVPVRDGRVIAFAVADGRKLWAVTLPITTGLAIDADRLFAITSEALIALDVSDGAIRWRAPISGASAPAAARAGWVIVGEGTDLRAFRGSDGQLVWQQEVGAAVAATVTIEGDRVYVPLADSTLAALDVRSGKPLWRVKTRAVPGRITAAGDRLFAGCADDFFYSFDASDGDRRWRWRAAADVLAPVAHDGERVYFTARDNVVRAVDFESGVQKWRHAMDVRPLAGPALDGDAVILASLGELRVVAAKDGALAGRWAAPAELAVAPLVLPRDAANGARAVIVTGATTGDWRVYVLARAVEPAPAPLKETPGRPLSPEGPPVPPGSPMPAASRLP